MLSAAWGPHLDPQPHGYLLPCPHPASQPELAQGRVWGGGGAGVIKKLLTSIPGSHVATQSRETKKSGASYIIASNLIPDSFWEPESNKCQAFYEGRKQIRGQGLESRPNSQ